MSDQLTTIKVNLLPGSVAALDAAAEQCGDTKTDTVNRALQLYQFVTKVLDGQPRHMEFEHTDGRRVEIYARVMVPKRRRWWRR